MIDVTQLSPWLLLVAPVVVLLAYTVFGLSGFGSTVIAVPILAHFLPVAYLVPLMAVLDVVSATFIGTTSREHVSKSELKWLLPFILVGFVLGVTLLVKVPEVYLRAALGVFAVAVGVNSILNPVLHRTISRLWCVPAGLMGGAIATVFGAGGPIYVTYLSGRLKDKNAIRSTMSTLISISAFIRAVIYAVTGLLLNLSVLAGLAVLSPFVWLGLRIGQRIHLGLSQQQLRRIVGVLLVLVGVSLLLRVWIAG
jgi:uncharacterized membrane protein YfcA